MGFRQHNKSPETVWRRKQRLELLSCGIPDSVVDDERRWTYVFLHAADEYGTGWDASKISKEKAARLLALLQEHYGEPPSSELIVVLKRRVAEE
jgi:hypothetical protein